VGPRTGQEAVKDKQLLTLSIEQEAGWGPELVKKL